MSPRHQFCRVAPLIVAVLLAFVSLRASAQTNQQRTPSPAELARAYEQSCIANLRTINVAQTTYSYWGENRFRGFARILGELGPQGLGFLDPVIASGKADDYRYQLTPEHTDHNQPVRHYTIVARPIKMLVNDQKSFFTDETGFIRYTSKNRDATSRDALIQASSPQ